MTDWATPDGLGVGGLQLWTTVTEAHDLDVTQVVQLTEACRAMIDHQCDPPPIFRFLLLAENNGKADVTAGGLALMLGTPVDELAPVVKGIRDPDDLPLELKHVGRQRASEAKAHADTENPALILAFWAAQQWGSRMSVSIEIEARQMWLTTTDPEVARWLGAGEAVGGIRGAVS